VPCNLFLVGFHWLRARPANHRHTRPAEASLRKRCAKLNLLSAHRSIGHDFQLNHRVLRVRDFFHSGSFTDVLSRCKKSFTSQDKADRRSRRNSMSTTRSTQESTAASRTVESDRNFWQELVRDASDADHPANLVINSILERQTREILPHALVGADMLAGMPMIYVAALHSMLMDSN
jgi:hypothetical protein